MIYSCADQVIEVSRDMCVGSKASRQVWSPSRDWTHHEYSLSPVLGCQAKDRLVLQNMKMDGDNNIRH